MFKSLSRLKHAFFPEINISDLSTILCGMNDHHNLDKRMGALSELMAWIRLPTPNTKEVEVSSHIQSKNLRFKFLIQYLERNPTEASYFVVMMRELLSSGTATRLYYLTGVSENTGFMSELVDRIMTTFLPRIYEERDLAELFRMVFTQKEDAEWFDLSYKIILPPIFNLLEKQKIDTSNLQRDMNDALIILGSQIASLGVTKGIRSRLTDKRISHSNFVLLSKSIINANETQNTILKEISACQESLQIVRRSLEKTGVSVDLIYNIERISALLQRVEMLIYLRQQTDIESKQIIISHFMASLIRDELHRLSIRDFLKEHMIMLTKKVVERAGEKGDNYIASTPQEKRHLFIAASWAGVLTAFTAVTKVLIGYVGFSLFFEGFFYFINYAIGFLLMQRWHLALSSKQPAYTASALSRKFEEFLHTKELSDITSEVKKISFSQFIASIANLLWVIPSVLALDFVFVLLSGKHLVTASYARTLIGKHDIVSSGTIIYAAFTGVLLWLSSVVAGWIENWIIFRNIPQWLRESTFLTRYMGKEKARVFTDKLAAKLGAASGNLSIALFLALPIIIGKVTGLPLDIRHVTLATGTITLALSSLPWDMTLLPLLVSMLISIIMIGFLNFGVSFYFAIRMAALARGVHPRYLKVIFKFAFFKKNPV